MIDNSNIEIVEHSDNTESREIRRQEVAQRFHQVLGPNWRMQLANTLGRDKFSIYRMFNPPKGRNDQPSVELVALSEFLVNTPKKYWPDRWISVTV